MNNFTCVRWIVVSDGWFVLWTVSLMKTLKEILLFCIERKNSIILV